MWIDTFEEKAEAYVDVLLANKVIGPQSFLKDDSIGWLYAGFIFFCMGTDSLAFGAVFEEEYVSNKSLLEGDAHRLHLLWVAVQIAVDMAGWYKWSLAQSAPDKAMLLVPPGKHDPNKCNNWGDETQGFLHSTPLFMIPTANDPKRFKFGHWAESGVPFLNPFAAAFFTWFEVCGGQSPASQTEGINKLVEWFRGPGNVHSSFDPLAPARRTEDFWAWKAGGYVVNGPPVQPSLPAQWQDVKLGDFDLTNSPAPFAYAVCRFSGKQAWAHISHSKRDYTYKSNNDATRNQGRLREWYSDAILSSLDVPVGVNAGKGIEYDSLGFLIRRKLGGCGPCASLFVASAISMNVPALYGENWHSGDWHHALWLPTLNKSMEHADNLWGPGAGLFPAAGIWNEDATATDLAPGRLRRAFREAEVQNPLDPNLVVLRAVAERAGLHTKYRTGRRCFQNMLNAIANVQYEQVVLDAVVFKSHAFPPIPNKGVCSFRAIRHWATVIGNPHRDPGGGANLPLGEIGAEQAVPIWLPSWGNNPSQYPANAWFEQSIQLAVLGCWAWFELGQHGYGLLDAADPMDDALFP
jgi:hypothetical protein